MQSLVHAALLSITLSMSYPQNRARALLRREGIWASSSRAGERAGEEQVRSGARAQLLATASHVLGRDNSA